MKTLLALITHLGESRSFIEYTIDLANHLGRNLFLLNIQVPPMSPPSIGTSGVYAMETQQNIEVNRKIGLDALEKELNQISKSIAMPNEIEINYDVEIGTADMMLEKYLSENTMDMVVIEGDEDEESFLFFSSSASDVIKNTDYPVWVIPKGANFNEFHKIVYATDYEDADIESLKGIVMMLNKYSLKITALHIAEHLNQEEKSLKEDFRQKVGEATHIPDLRYRSLMATQKDLGEKINDYAVGNNYDLIVIMKKHHNFLERLFTSSSTKNVVREAKLPILVFHEPRSK